jgi:DNA-binding SARP family transcriptional activator
VVDVRSAGMRFEVLGPLRAWRDGVDLSLGPIQQRVVLAVLLLNTNRPIGRAQIINAVWGGAHPTHAVNLLQRHVSGLRRVLEPERSARAMSDRVVWTSGGYLFTVASGALDLGQFDEHTAGARSARAAGDLSKASEELHAALKLWRGPACDGLASPFLDAQRERLAERQISTLEDRIDLDLALGNHQDLIAELRALVADNPLRERLRGLLMSALYRAGRQADALAAYQDARRHLLDEVGVAPGAPLQRLQQQILAADPHLTAPVQRPTIIARAEIGHRPPAASVPAQLPHDLVAFVGRETELGQLDRLLDAGTAHEAGSVVISAITGMPGVGKSALALHWAHRVSDRFPDGQLYLNLHGFDRSQHALEPTEAIRILLDAFAVPAEQLPSTLDGRSALYRSLLAGRRMLIMLDNARDAEQLRPLLPGSPGCLVLITSRNQLSSLTALDGAEPLTLDLPMAAEARTMFGRRLAQHRLAVEPAAADEIVSRCGRLPLALSIVAARAGRGFTLAQLAQELRDGDGRLDSFDGGDQLTNIRGVFAWSYRCLSLPAARLFRLITLLPGPDFPMPVIASLAGLSLPSVHALLGELSGGHLVQERAPGRFALHPLLHDFATELSHIHDSDDERHAALYRALDHQRGLGQGGRELVPAANC